MTHPEVIPGFEKHQFINDPVRAREHRDAYPLLMCRWLAEDMARRIAASQKLFPWKFFRGDCHSHTVHSDGVGTVAETAEMVKAAGLDFQWVTDHWGLTQGPECRKHGLWVGQEPITDLHHMGILNLGHTFVPQKKFYADIAAAKAGGAAVFIPHPAGWWPRTVYSAKQKRALDKLPDPFLMEICNGANNIVNAFDYTDVAALEVWDHLLSLGKIVHAMGNTDAHAPHCIGTVWNNVFADRCDEPTILKTLGAGHNFISDGPLVHIKLGKAAMGDRASEGDRRGKLAITAVDSRGLSHVRAVAGGKEIGRWLCDSKPKWTRQIVVPRTAKKYVRVEVRSLDARSAFSNPIYLP